jgi:2-dehydropantoate 2-reductase
MQIHDGRSPGDNHIARSHHSRTHVERRLNAAGSAAGHKISMLQDLERGRSLEIDALVTAVQEVGRLIKVATPTIDTVLTLVQERGRQAGLYGNDAQR